MERSSATPLFATLPPATALRQWSSHQWRSRTAVAFGRHRRTWGEFSQARPNATARTEKGEGALARCFVGVGPQTFRENLKAADEAIELRHLDYPPPPTSIHLNWRNSWMAITTLLARRIPEGIEWSCRMSLRSLDVFGLGAEPRNEFGAFLAST